MIDDHPVILIVPEPGPYVARQLREVTIHNRKEEQGIRGAKGVQHRPDGRTSRLRDSAAPAEEGRNVHDRGFVSLGFDEELDDCRFHRLVK